MGKLTRYRNFSIFTYEVYSDMARPLRAAVNSASEQLFRNFSPLTTMHRLPKYTFNYQQKKRSIFQKKKKQKKKQKKQRGEEEAQQYYI